MSGQSSGDGRVYAVAARRCRKLRAAVAVRGSLVGMRGIVPIPGHRRKFLVTPLGLHRSTTPLIAKIIEHINQPALSLRSSALHDVKVGVSVQYCRFSAGMFMMRGNECVNAVGRAGARQFAVEIVPPEHAWITVSGQNEGVAEHLVVDYLITAHVMILNKGHRIERATRGYRFTVSQIAQIIAELVANVFELVAKREIECGNLLVSNSAHAVQPVIDVFRA